MVIELSKKGVDAIFGGEEEKGRIRRLLHRFEEEAV